jgi:sterol desaturase/sphingolipid hydroxylase (fatty acid hydroxylase superfamily)
MVDGVSSWFEGLRAGWRALLPGTMERAFANALILGCFYYVLVFVIERACRTRTANYRSRGFAHDVAYYFYVKGGLEKYVIPVTLFAALKEPLASFGPGLLDGLAYPLQFVLWLVVADFVQYWMHRAKHYFKFLWAFHTTHHSQEHLTFATFARIHPVEDLFGQFVHLFILFWLGADPISSLFVFLVLDAIDQTQHTQIPWRLGPLYGILVTPAFHSYHHSTDPAHHNRNFGLIFSVWDRMFGTAVPAHAPAPTRFGLDDVKAASLWDTLAEPFRLLYQFYGTGGLAKPGPDTSAGR